MTVLTPDVRRRLIQRVMATSTWPELRALEREIARDYAATPEQRAMNEAELAWLRPIAAARRQMVGRDGHASPPSSTAPAAPPQTRAGGTP